MMWLLMCVIFGPKKDPDSIRDFKILLGCLTLWVIAMFIPAWLGIFAEGEALPYGIAITIIDYIIYVVLILKN